MLKSVYHAHQKTIKPIRSNSKYLLYITHKLHFLLILLIIVTVYNMVVCFQHVYQFSLVHVLSFMHAMYLFLNKLRNTTYVNGK